MSFNQSESIAGLTVKHQWRPSLAIRVSMLLHAGVLAGLVVALPLWKWFAGILFANHLLLAIASLWLKGSLLGPNLVRLPAAAIARGEISLTFDDGPDPVVTPQVLDLLDHYQAKASFFCVAEKADAFPDIVREIVRRGHSVENHSYHHSYCFAFYGLFRLRREVASAQMAIAGITGRSPEFFRAPAGFRSPFLDPVLARHGLRYVSWTRRGFDGVRCDPPQVLRRLTRGLAAGDVLLLHDGSGVCVATGEAAVLTVLPALLEEMPARGLRSVSLPNGFLEVS